MLGNLEPVLGSGHNGDRADPLSRVGSSPFQTCISADYENQNRVTSMPSSERTSLRQASDVSTSQRDLAAVALPSPPHYSPASRTCARGSSMLDHREAVLSSRDQGHPPNITLPPPTPSSASVVSLICKGTGSGPAVSKHIAKTRRQPSLSPLFPGLLNPANISSDELVLRERDLHSSPKRPQKGRRVKRDHRVSRPPDISMLDYGLPKDFGGYLMNGGHHLFH